MANNGAVDMVQNLLTAFRSISRFKSLSFQLLLGMIIWLIFALIFTGYTLLLSWELENGGMAINDAGSLRKRTFQMALLHNQAPNSPELQAEQAEFEHVLLNLRNVGHGKLFLPDNSVLRAQVAGLELRWHEQMLPWYAQLTQTQQNISAHNRQQLDDYANSINRVVKLIEDDNTRNIRLLRLFQMLLIFMTFLTAFTGIHLLLKLVIRPLEGLRAGIVRLSDGDLKARVISHQQNEFGLVSKGFNQMAASLQDLYAHLEDKVAEKTHALGERNQELSTLYAVTAYLHESHTIEEMSRGFIEQILHISGAQAGSVRLLDTRLNQLNYLASIGLSQTMIQALQSAEHTCVCDVMHLNQITTIYPQNLEAEATHCRKAGFTKVILFPVRFYSHELGIFTLYFDEEVSLDGSLQRVIEALCSQLGVAIENQRLIARDRQFAVVEERNLMAQGLHDSIAQTLSFLNMQVQMLEDALNNQQDEQAQENLAFIKNGVQESYEDVRELLLNFRTRLNKQDFVEAARSVLQRFEQQARITTRLNIQGGECWLSPQQQLQVIFILQEALSNVRKHAQAQNVRVDIHHQANAAGDFVMSIEDDGIGFEANTLENKRTRHVGTAIMHERAHLVNASVQIHSHLGRGTRVELILPGKEHVTL